ncbi:MAG: hypothetical protein MHPSP_003917, partial [Paramarteilia canceri]
MQQAWRNFVKSFAGNNASNLESEKISNERRRSSAGNHQSSPVYNAEVRTVLNLHTFENLGLCETG